MDNLKMVNSTVYGVLAFLRYMWSNEQVTNALNVMISINASFMPDATNHAQLLLFCVYFVVTCMQRLYSTM